MTVAANDRNEAGIRKAAIFMASLDRATADLLLDQLGPECADLVRQATMAIDEINANERQQVVDEFHRIGTMIPKSSPAGIELDGLAVPVEQKFASAPEQAGTPAAGNDLPPFGFLRETEEKQLLQLLSGERPQAIAMVLSQLPPGQAGQLLAQLAPPLQVEVVRRLVDLDSIDAETLREVEQALEARLSRQFDVERRRTAGPETVAKIFAACDSHAVGNILDNLVEYDQPLAVRFGGRPFTFEDVEQLDDATLLAVFRAAEPEVAQAALLGAAPQLVERVLRGMASGKTKRLRRALDWPEPIRLSDIEDAQQQIATLARRMSRSTVPKHAIAA
jgi:flagellar motor switch protein FliG